MAIAWIYARHVNWDEHTSRPSRQLVVELSGLSASTVKRWTRWLRTWGLLGELERGCLAKFRPRHRGDDTQGERPAGGRASVQVLCIPDRWAYARLGQPKPPSLVPPVVESVSVRPPGLPVDETDPSTQLLLSLEESPFARENQPGPLRGPDGSAELRQALNEAVSAAGPADQRWSRHAVARTQAERLALAAALQSAAPDLARVSTRNIRSVLRPWLTDPALGWSVHWLQWAVDHAPDGSARTWTSAVHSPAGWLRSRLSAWAGADGGPATAPGIAIAATRDRERARLAADRAEQDRLARHADAQHDFGDRIRAIAGDGYGQLRAAVLSATSVGGYLPAAARDALVRQAVCEELADGEPMRLAEVSDAAVRSAIDAVLVGHGGQPTSPVERLARRRSVGVCRDAGSRPETGGSSTNVTMSTTTTNGSKR
ncbi:MAG: hypothetical protein DLM61_20900 [Pseudonocardiales bacterium]|nr:MAG: hypothetical protein DLM61_20900 [Pseudonocardiales bacterium]